MSDKLFREFAVDPSLLDRNQKSLGNISSIYLLHHFGWDKGNIICMPDFNKSLDSNKYPVIRRKLLDSQPTIWVDWVIYEHERKGFTKIICSEKTIKEIEERIKEINEKADNERKPIVWETFREYLIVWEALHKYDCECFFGTHKRVRRTAQNLVSSIDLFLLYSPIITLVDPYFGNRGGCNDQFDTLKSIVELLRDSDVYAPTIFAPKKNVFKKFLIHCCGDKNNVNSVKSCLHQYVNSITSISQGLIEFRIIFWTNDKHLHNRYVLSRSGGIMFGHGLDPGINTDDIATISEIQGYRDMFIFTENAWQTHRGYFSEYSESTHNP